MPSFLILIINRYRFYSPLVSANDFIEGLRESLQFPEALRHAVQVLIKLPKAGETIVIKKQIKWIDSWIKNKS